MERERFQAIFSPRLLMLFLWCAVIFAFSHRPGSGVPFDPPLWYIIERKGAHVFEYAVLTLLAWRYFLIVFQGESVQRILVLTGVFALTYGMLDELHQFFIFGRSARFTDVLVDLLGIVLMCAAIALWQRRR